MPSDFDANSSSTTCLIGSILGPSFVLSPSTCFDWSLSNVPDSTTAWPPDNNLRDTDEVLIVPTVFTQLSLLPRSDPAEDFGFCGSTEMTPSHGTNSLSSTFILSAEAGTGSTTALHE